MKPLDIIKSSSSVRHTGKYFSIRWKLLLFTLTLIILPIVIVGFSVYQTYRHEAIENVRRDLQLVANGWAVTTDVYRNELARILKREEYLVERRLASSVLDIRKMIELFDEVKPGATLSEMEPLLKKISSIRVGRSGHPFIIDQQGRYVLARNRKDDGTNVASAPQSNPTEFYLGILREVRHLKRDDVKIAHYAWADSGTYDSRMMVSAMMYLPQRGWIVGLSTYYTDFKSYELERILQDELKGRMAKQRIGQRGYVWVVDSAGKFLVSKDRLRDGEYVISARDRKGAMPILEIIQQARGLAPDQALFKEYEWRDIGEVSYEKRLASAVYFPGWDWVIVASAYEDDFLQGLQAIRRQTMLICLTFVLLGSLLAIIFASRLSRPIQKLESIAASGDLSHAASDAEVMGSNDEIGRLGLAFAGMVRRVDEQIAEIERSRQELLESNIELKRAQEQVIRSEKLAAIGQLSAGVAHEINNPLAYVISNIETLEKYLVLYEQAIDEHSQIARGCENWQDLAEARAQVQVVLHRLNDFRMDAARRDIKDLMKDVLHGLDRVRQIVLDLRMFARHENEEKADEDLEDVIDKVLVIAQGSIKGHVKVVREYGEIPLVFCNAQRIAQVFMNIVVNAAQAMEKAGGILTIRTQKDGEHVQVIFADTGSGISLEDKLRLFEPFFTTKPAGQGTGLGLSISYEIIRNHGGNITVESILGQGATFTVHLPCKA